METNVLGLPSLTGFTPLKASQEGQILKYDFKDIGPRVLDKSGNMNGGMLAPMWPVNSPRRSVPPGTLKFDGKDDYVKVSDDPTLDGMSTLTVAIKFRPLISPEEIDRDRAIVSKKYNETYELTLGHRGGFYFQITNEAGRREYAHGGEWRKGEWTEILGCYAGGPTQPRIYQDGEVVGAATQTGSVGTSDKPLTIGSRPGPSNFSKIEVEWVKLYRRYYESV